MTNLYQIPGLFGSFISYYTILDANNEQAAHCGYWQTPDGASRSITHICWVVNAKTTDGTVTCSLETIDDATGLPAGVIAGKTGNEAVTAAGYFETALGAAYTLTSGTKLAVSFKIGNPGNLRVGKGGGILVPAVSQIANWVCEDLGGAGWSVYSGATVGCALKTSLGEYIIPLGSIITTNVTTINIATTPTNPRYVGNRLSCSKQTRITGFILPRLDLDVDVSVKLCDATGAVLKGDDTALDMAVLLDSSNRSGTSVIYNSIIPFPSQKTLLADTNYYLMFFPESGTNLPIYYSDYNSEAQMKQFTAIPTMITLRAATAADGWNGAEDITETATRTYSLLPVLDQIDFVDISDADLTVAEAPTGKKFYAVSGGVKTGTGTKTLSAANETVAAGYYAATTLSAVDADLAVGNISAGVTIFGFAGEAAGGGGVNMPRTRIGH
jgi:hypothetical protein